MSTAKRRHRTKANGTRRKLKPGVVKVRTLGTAVIMTLPASIRKTFRTKPGSYLKLTADKKQLTATHV